MIKLDSNFEEPIDIFNKNNVRYLVVGAYGMSNYGYIRSTSDLDIWIDHKHNNPSKVVKSLNEFGFEFDDQLIREFSHPERRLVVGHPPSQIDRRLCKTVFLIKLGVIDRFKSSHILNILRFESVSSLDLDQKSWFFKAF